jgi:hypothetical protein
MVAKKHDDEPKSVPTSKTMGQTDKITAAKLDALYHAVVALRGGAPDDEMRKLFEGDGE